MRMKSSKKATKVNKKSQKKTTPLRSKKAPVSGPNYVIVSKPKKPSFSDAMIGRMLAVSKSY